MGTRKLGVRAQDCLKRRESCTDDDRWSTITVVALRSGLVVCAPQLRVSVKDKIDVSNSRARITMGRPLHCRLQLLSGNHLVHLPAMLQQYTPHPRLHTSIHTHTHTHTHTHIHTHTYIHRKNTHTHIHIHIHKHKILIYIILIHTLTHSHTHIQTA